MKCNPFIETSKSLAAFSKTIIPTLHSRVNSFAPQGLEKNKKPTKKFHIKNKTSANFYTKVPIPSNLTSKHKSIREI